jgi:hypothetical protein
MDSNTCDDLIFHFSLRLMTAADAGDKEFMERPRRNAGVEVDEVRAAAGGTAWYDKFP